MVASSFRATDGDGQQRDIDVRTVGAAGAAMARPMVMRLLDKRTPG